MALRMQPNALGQSFLATSVCVLALALVGSHELLEGEPVVGRVGVFVLGGVLVISASQLLLLIGASG